MSVPIVQDVDESEVQTAVWNQFVRKSNALSMEPLSPGTQDYIHLQPLASGNSDILHLPKIADSTATETS